MGVAQNTISNWVTGASKISFDEGVEIAAHLGVTLDELAGKSSQASNGLSSRSRAWAKLGDLIESKGIADLVNWIESCEKNGIVRRAIAYY